MNHIDNQTMYGQGEEARTVQAVGTVMRRGLCNLILLGNQEKIETLAKQFRVDISQVRIVDPRNSPDTEKYAKDFYESRRHKVNDLEILFASFPVRISCISLAMSSCPSICRLHAVNLLRLLILNKLKKFDSRFDIIDGY